MAADADELVYGRCATHDGPVAYFDFAGKEHVVHDYAVASHHAVVRYVCTGHDEIVVADNRLSLGGRTAVYGGRFPDGVVVAHFDRGVFAFELEVLRNAGYHCTGVYLASLAHACSIQYHGVGPYPGAVAYHHVARYVCERFHYYVFAEPCVRMDIG